jgi:hypothetical protein
MIGDTAPVLFCAPQVAVYPVMALPPLFPGGVKLTETCPSPAVAVPMVGASGTVASGLKLAMTVQFAVMALVV